MSKPSFSSKLKITLLKGMEAIGTSASNLAKNAKLKVNEINLETRRREILTDFSLQAFELWQKGVQLPGPLSEMLTELSEIEDRLSVLRAQKYAQVASSEPTADRGNEPAEPGEDADTEAKEEASVACSIGDTESATDEPVACTLGDVDTASETSVDPNPDPTAEHETEADSEGDPFNRGE